MLQTFALLQMAMKTDEVLKILNFSSFWKISRTFFVELIGFMEPIEYMVLLGALSNVLSYDLITAPVSNSQLLAHCVI